MAFNSSSWARTCSSARSFFGAVVQAAARRWALDAAALRVEDGQVRAPDGRTLSYVALAEAAALLVLQKKAQAIWGDDGDD